MALEGNLWSLVFIDAALLLLHFAGSGDAIFCPDPGTPTNGSRVLVDRSQYEPGTIVRFSCNNGLQLQGAPKAECYSSGLWSSGTPSCVDHCNNKCQNKGACVATRHMSNSVTYRCICTKEFTGESCDIRLCLFLPSVRYSNVILISGKSDGQSFTAGSIVQYTCNPGFTISGRSRLTCDGTGMWTPHAPVCRQSRCMNEYNSPSYSLQHGDYYPKMPAYDMGASVLFLCNAGYRLVGNSMNQCSRNGNWARGTWPRCLIVSCPQPYPIPYGHYSLDSSERVVNSRVRYYCKQHFYRWGPAEQRCVAKGSTGALDWSPQRGPECITKEEFTKRCQLQGQVMSYISLSCVSADHEKNCVDCKQTASKESLTIVTAASGAFLAMLLIVVAVVACQRRRLMRRLRRGAHRPRLGSRASSDHMRFVYCANSLHFVLPSYDEAIRANDTDPPPFDAAVGGSDVATEMSQSTGNHGTHPSTTAASDSTEEEELYEAIDDATAAPATEAPSDNSDCQLPTTSPETPGDNLGNNETSILAIEVAEDALDTSDTAPLLTD